MVNESFRDKLLIQWSINSAKASVNCKSFMKQAPGADFIKELQLAELQIAKRAHWSLSWKRVATTNGRVLQFAIVQL